MGVPFYFLLNAHLDFHAVFNTYPKKFNFPFTLDLESTPSVTLLFEVTYENCRS